VCDGLTDVDDEPLVAVRRLVVVRRQGEATQVIVVATCTPDSQTVSVLVTSYSNVFSQRLITPPCLDTHE